MAADDVMLRDMAPVDAAVDEGYCGLRDAEPSADRPLWLTVPQRFQNGTHISVGKLRVRMPLSQQLGAVSLAVGHVFRRCARSQVSRVHAILVAAGMKDVQPVRDWADKKGIRRPVRRYESTVHPELPVSVRPLGLSPQPTRRGLGWVLLNRIKEACPRAWSFVERIAMPTTAEVVLVAQPVSVVLGVATGDIAGSHGGVPSVQGFGAGRSNARFTR